MGDSAMKVVWAIIWPTKYEGTTTYEVWSTRALARARADELNARYIPGHAVYKVCKMILDQRIVP